MMFFTIMAFPLPTQPMNTNVLPTAINLTKSQLRQLACMAKNIYYEAGSEIRSGQAAIARVVLNRVNQGFAETPCKVIYQKTLVKQNTVCQFSWVCANAIDPNKDSLKYKQAEAVAYEVMIMGMYKNVIPKTALFFHSIYIDPLWPYKQVAKIGNHVFYSNTRSK